MIAAERTDGVLRVTLDRPDKLNAMTDAMWSRLDELLARAADDAETRVVVLTGAGGAFCAGSDLSGLVGDHSDLPERIRLSNRVVARLHDGPVPTIAAVDGIAAGAGANLALACDFVVASDRARFLQAFVRRGLSLDSGGSWLLPRLVGERRARELALLGESLDAATALAWGAVNTVVPAAALGAEVDRLAGRLRGFSGPALAGTKTLLNRTWGEAFAEGLESELTNQLAVIETDEARSAMRSFLSEK